MTDITEIIVDQNIQDGFYSWENDTLNFAPNFVQWPDGELIQRADKDTYEYPIRGYYWFETRAQALSFFNKPDPDIDTSLVTDLAKMGMYGDLDEVGTTALAPDPDFDDMIADPDEYLYKDEDLVYDPGNPDAEAEDCVSNPNFGHPSHAY